MVPPRGLFGQYSFVKFGEISDGTSNTLAMSEHVIGKDGEVTIHGAYVAKQDWNTSLADNPAANCYVYKGSGTYDHRNAPPAVSDLRGVELVLGWCGDHWIHNHPAAQLGRLHQWCVQNGDGRILCHPTAITRRE